MRLFFFCIFASDNKSRQMKTYPLTFAQAEIYYAWAQHKESVAYNLPQVLPYPTSVDPERLRQAVIEIWKIRKVLRTRLYSDKSGHPRQFEGPMPKLPVTICQMTEQEAVSYINNGFVRPFKIDAGEPMARFEILCTESHNYLLFDIHHLISDGYTLSSLLVGNDIPHAYNGFPLTDGDYGLYDVAQKALPMRAKPMPTPSNISICISKGWISLKSLLPALALPADGLWSAKTSEKNRWTHGATGMPYRQTC